MYRKQNSKQNYNDPTLDSQKKKKKQNKKFQKIIKKAARVNAIVKAQPKPQPPDWSFLQKMRRSYHHPADVFWKQSTRTESPLKNALKIQERMKQHSQKRVHFSEDTPTPRPRRVRALPVSKTPRSTNHNHQDKDDSSNDGLLELLALFNGTETKEETKIIK